MSIVCEIVKDLVPLHLDGTASRMTDSLIKRHIRRCASCSEYYRLCADSKQAAAERAKENEKAREGVDGAAPREVVYAPDDGYMLVARRIEKSMLIERIAFLAAGIAGIAATFFICRAYWGANRAKKFRE